VYTQPDPEARIAQFTWFFTQLARDEARKHGVYAAVRMNRLDAAAVWTSPMPTAPAEVGLHSADEQQPPATWKPLCRRT
jgi:hypothetical protein